MKKVKYKKTVILINRDVVVDIRRVVIKNGKHISSTRVLKTRFSADNLFNSLKRLFIKSENDLIKQEFCMAHNWADKQIEILKQQESL